MIKYKYDSVMIAKLSLEKQCFNVKDDVDDEYISYLILNFSSDYVGDTGMVKVMILIMYIELLIE